MPDDFLTRSTQGRRSPRSPRTPRSPRRRRSVAHTLALVLALAVAVFAAGIVVIGREQDARHPLVASSQRQPAAGMSTPASDPEEDDSTDGAGADGLPTGEGSPRGHDSAPGHSQGGSVIPSPAPGPSLNVPILLYHYIRGNPRASDREGFRLSVTPANFAQQMALLHADGAHTVSLGDVMSALAAGVQLPPRSVVLTFDDGHDDFAFRAVPVLQEYGFSATSFVVPGFLGRSSYMTRAQLASVVAAGMTIGAHTMHHIDLAVVAPRIAEGEITQSRTELQQLTGQPIDDFAYPYGIFNSRVVEMVKKAGFADASTTELGVRQYASQPFLLRRIEISGYDSLFSFAKKAELPPPPRSWVVPRTGTAKAAPPASGAPSPGEEPPATPGEEPSPPAPADSPSPRPIIG